MMPYTSGLSNVRWSKDHVGSRHDILTCEQPPGFGTYPCECAANQRSLCSVGLIHSEYVFSLNMRLVFEVMRDTIMHTEVSTQLTGCCQMTKVPGQAS